MRPPCVFCRNGDGKAGKLLKCLHKICLDCLPDSVQQDGKIHCSKCRRYTPCPPPGRTHQQVLVDDSMFHTAPDSHDGTKKTNETDNVLEVFADENMNLSSIPQQPTSSFVVRSTVVDAQGFHKQIPHGGRVHVCPYHSTMKLRYWCTRCREVLCERCKLQVKHASHMNQINEATEVAAALRHRLTERLRNLDPDDKGKEVDESLDYAGNLVTAFECYSASQVSSIKTMIHEQCQDLLFRVKKRKEELIGEGEIRKKEFIELVDHCRETNNVTGTLQHILDARRYALRNEDLIQMSPKSIQCLTEAYHDIVAKGSSRMPRMILTCKQSSKLDGHFGAMGKVVDNTAIDLSSCSFPHKTCVAFVGDRVNLTALVRNSRSQPLSDTALKVSSIQIWATRIESGFSPAAPVLVPISRYSKGEVHAHVHLNYSQPTAFLLELLLNTPSRLPGFQNGSLARNVNMYFPLKTWLFVFRSRASYLAPHFIYPRESVKSGVMICNLSQAFPGVEIRQVKDGVATARATEPVQNRDFGVTFIVIQCTSGKLDIGFTWHCAETSHASSANSNSSSCPICDVVTGDLIHITRCPYKQDKYNIDHYCIGSGLLKSHHDVRIGPNIKPTLMVRMFGCGTLMKVYEHNKEQRNIFMQNAKRLLDAQSQRVENRTRIA